MRALLTVKELALLLLVARLRARSERAVNQANDRHVHTRDALDRRSKLVKLGRSAFEVARCGDKRQHEFVAQLTDNGVEQLAQLRRGHAETFFRFHPGSATSEPEQHESETLLSTARVRPTPREDLQRQIKQPHKLEKLRLLEAEQRSKATVLVLLRCRRTARFTEAKRARHFVTLQRQQKQRGVARLVAAIDRQGSH